MKDIYFYSYPDFVVRLPTFYVFWEAGKEDDEK